MNTKYTEAGERELGLFKRKQVSLLEDIIRERKYIFGDEELEITASDIMEAESMFRVVRSSSYRERKLYLTQYLLKLYAILGISTIFLGITYPYLQNIFVENRTQFLIVAGGIFMSALSSLMFFWVRQREQRYRRMEEMETELIRLPKQEKYNANKSVENNED